MGTVKLLILLSIAIIGSISRVKAFDYDVKSSQECLANCLNAQNVFCQ